MNGEFCLNAVVIGLLVLLLIGAIRSLVGLTDRPALGCSTITLLWFIPVVGWIIIIVYCIGLGAVTAFGITKNVILKGN